MCHVRDVCVEYLSLIFTPADVHVLATASCLLLLSFYLYNCDIVFLCCFKKILYFLIRISIYYSIVPIIYRIPTFYYLALTFNNIFFLIFRNDSLMPKYTYPKYFKASSMFLRRHCRILFAEIFLRRQFVCPKSYSAYEASDVDMFINQAQAKCNWFTNISTTLSTKEVVNPSYILLHA